MSDLGARAKVDSGKLPTGSNSAGLTTIEYYGKINEDGHLMKIGVYW